MQHYKLKNEARITDMIYSTDLISHPEHNSYLNNENLAINNDLQLTKFPDRFTAIEPHDLDCLP